MKVMIKLVTALSISIFLMGCANTMSHQGVKIPNYRYCESQHVTPPHWYYDAFNRGDYVTWFGVRYREGIEKHITVLGRSSLGEQVYSQVTSVSTREYDSRRGNNFDFNFTTSSVTNLYLTEAKVSHEVHNGCVVIWGTISEQAARDALRRKRTMDQYEHQEWLEINTSTRISDYENFIQYFPYGRFRRHAEGRIKMLKRGYREPTRR